MIFADLRANTTFNCHYEFYSKAKWTPRVFQPFDSPFPNQIFFIQSTLSENAFCVYVFELS